MLAVGFSLDSVFFCQFYLLISSVVKNSPANAGDVNSIPWLGRSPVEGDGNPIQYSCLENPMDRGA